MKQIELKSFKETIKKIKIILDKLARDYEKVTDNEKKIEMKKEIDNYIKLICKEYGNIQS